MKVILRICSVVGIIKFGLWTVLFPWSNFSILVLDLFWNGLNDRALKKLSVHLCFHLCNIIPLSTGQSYCYLPSAPVCLLRGILLFGQLLAVQKYENMLVWPYLAVCSIITSELFILREKGIPKFKLILWESRYLRPDELNP